MHEMWRRFAAQPLGLLGAVFVLALLAAALLAPSLLGIDPNALSNEVLKPPSALHPLGTDELGRDVLVNLVYGIRVSLWVGFFAAVAATVLGVVIGAVAGFEGGAVDLLAMRVAEIFQVVPSFILAAVIVAFAGPGLGRIVAVIALLAWPQTARLMRGEVLRLKGLEFVDAVRCLGLREGEILLREILPNALPPVLAMGTLIIAQAILLEAGLSFLGLSSPDIVSWGKMLNSGQRFLFNAWWLSFFPGSAIFLTVLAFNLLGDAVGAALDPRRGA